MQLPLGDVTVYVTSITPFWGRKKSCTPRLAWSSVSTCGSVGSSADVPAAVDVNVCVYSFAYTIESMSFPDAAHSGVLKYSYSGTVSCSVRVPSGPLSKS